jgi:hypothetical protein
MKLLDYILVALVLIWLIAAGYRLFSMKKQGKSICCGSSCSGCKGCDMYKKAGEH